MLPLLPFAAGLVAGAAAVSMLRSERARAGLAQAQDALRSATESGLAALKRSSATVKQGFSAGEAPAQTAAEAAAPAAPKAAKGGARKAPPRKKAATPAAKPATGRGGTRRSAKAKRGAAS